jgi:hypothetical protein
MSHKVTAIGKGKGLVRNVLQISNERSAPINDFVLTAAKNPSRTAEYIAETMSQVSELCQTNEELAYAGYVIGIFMGPTEELKGAVLEMIAAAN